MPDPQIDVNLLDERLRNLLREANALPDRRRPVVEPSPNSQSRDWTAIIFNIITIVILVLGSWWNLKSKVDEQAIILRYTNESIATHTVATNKQIDDLTNRVTILEQNILKMCDKFTEKINKNDSQLSIIEERMKK